MTVVEKDLRFNDAPTVETESTRGMLYVLIAQRGSAWATEAAPVTTNALDRALQEQIYEELQRIEESLPIPDDSEIVDMGTFNVANGTFTGKTSRQDVQIIGGKPKTITTRASDTIDAVNVQLRFNFQARGLALLRVFTNGVPTVVPTGGNSVTIDLGKAQEIAWRIETNLFRVQNECVLRHSLWDLRGKGSQHPREPRLS
ncbi:MAG: hypothetical protein AB7G75_20685 [Candidatus Binatia bacterium]